MDRVSLVLTGALYAPIAATVALVTWRPPSVRAAAGIFFATAWSFASLLAMNELAIWAGWWRFAPTELGLFGIPFEMHLGWALWWGAVPALAAPRARGAFIVAAMVVFDLLAMPRLAPALELGQDWLAGEALSVALVLIPALFLYRWTRDDTHLAVRATLLCLTFGTLMFVALPTVILAHTGGSWSRIAALADWKRSIALQLMAIPAVLAISAVQEFAVRGGGTAVPFDGPKRVVASGAYAYLANPMQLGNTLLLSSLGALLASWPLAAAGVMSALFAAGFAEWHEDADLSRRFGDAWREYRRHVRAWIPRWRPYVPADRRPLLYVSETCGKCRQVSRWFRAREAVALTITPAEHHPTRDLERITYDPGDGTPEVQGIHAVARALEHINFGWALVGMVARLPGVSVAIQAFLDASGAGPQHVTRCKLIDPAAATR